MRFIFKHFIKAPILFLGLFFLIVFAPSQTYAWDAVLGATVGNQLHWLYDSIKGAALAAVKQTAVQTLNITVNTMVGGKSSADALFIVDWQDYLFTQPNNQARLYMNDYFSQLSNGKNSSNYTSASSEGFYSSKSGDYATDMIAQVKNYYENPTSNAITYEGNPDEMFKNGNLDDFARFISNPMNSSFGTALDASVNYQIASDLAQQEAAIRAISYNGFKAKESNGKVITPGSIIKDITSNVQDLGNKVIASATNIPEVMTSLVTRMITQSIQQGIGNIQSNLQKEINSANSKFNSEITSKAKSSGVSAYFYYDSRSN